MRASDQYGGAAASVGRAKQRRIINTTSLLLQADRGLGACRVRFDVIIVRDGAIEWLQHAFSA
jgi:putative endonuclease